MPSVFVSLSSRLNHLNSEYLWKFYCDLPNCRNNQESSWFLEWVMSKLFSLGGSITDSVPAGRSGEAGGAFSPIAAERMVGSGRDQAHSMRQSTGTTMACVTWRYVPRGTCHMPPREPLRKQALGQNFRRGGRRDPKLVGYMRPGMAHVPCKWRPQGVKILPAGGNFVF